MKAVFILLGLLTTEGQPSYELHKTADNSMVTPWPKTEQECIDRAKASEGDWTCVTRRRFKTTGTCDDVPKPLLPRELDADGYVVKPPIRAKQLNDTDWQTEIQDYVPAPYPACWALGWRVIAEADLTDAPEELVMDEPPPVWPEELQARWVASCPYRHEAGVYYPEDTCA